MAIIYFILILGVTIFVHELGHFMMAKKFGVHVYEFSLGMGPKLFKFNRKNDETDYCIRLFPIGGFVQMAGEEIEVDEDIPEEKRLQSKPAFQRFLIMVAGVTMNFILALVVLFIVGLFSKGISMDTLYIADSSVDGLKNGAKITAIDGHFVNNYDKLQLELIATNYKSFTVKTNDGNVEKINPIKIGKSSMLYGKNYGFSIDYNKANDENSVVVINSKLDDVIDGTKIVAVNGNKVNIYHELIDELNKADNKVTFTFKNDSETFDKEIEVKKEKKDEILGYSYGFSIEGHDEKGFIAAIKYAFTKFFSTIEQMFFTIIYLITGKISFKLLAGPVGMYSIVDTYSHYGFMSILSLLSLICINVGFINILPLPAFDGGHVVFIIIEKIKGSRVSPKVENTIHTVGLVILMLLMVLVTYNDIIRIFQK